MGSMSLKIWTENCIQQVYTTILKHNSVETSGCHMGSNSMSKSWLKLDTFDVDHLRTTGMTTGPPTCNNRSLINFVRHEAQNGSMIRKYKFTGSCTSRSPPGARHSGTILRIAWESTNDIRKNCSGRWMCTASRLIPHDKTGHPSIERSSITCLWANQDTVARTKKNPIWCPTIDRWRDKH